MFICSKICESPGNNLGLEALSADSRDVFSEITTAADAERSPSRARSEAE